ncbi:PREDICTED: mannose-6-phosphate isomerase isoform X2 [Cyphomyrmex costatus]|uniref:mannose-6-phosphate isomerase isoform X2 n=1 Tax=Cyphomyrmex costatus TaxID=456900 RepID=UPI0008522E08|nr:PREDICTED: mannose-6-phosphate isomerase isoform X2 [Cyphomyrmex costatus]
MKRGSIPCLCTELNLALTLHGGQSFRWTACDNGYKGIFNGSVWTLSQNKTHLLYTVQGHLKDSVNYDNILSEYFRLSVPLKVHYEQWAKADTHFQKCLDENNAVRILKQDVVENLFSFICSSNNNILRYFFKMELKCTVQTYAWGKLGMNSIVASLIKSANADFVVDEQKTYAELWMGTHENGPSYLKDTDIPLHKYIQENTEALGNNVAQTFCSNLPFLFKVLSINKALSIQVHPNKTKAKELHKLYPDIYKDPNHKPELAIALCPFEALCGFRPIDEIKDYVNNIPELLAVIGETNSRRLFQTDDSMVSDALQQSFHSLMTCDSNEVAQQLRSLIDRLENTDDYYRQLVKADLLERLHNDYPGDVGCFTIYLFNYVTMLPGEAIYIGPNVPHAYLSGDCIECMACSDNVIRAGLTPKPKDIETLIQVLSFECKSIEKIQPSREDTFTQVFRPPVSEFAVAKITLPPGQSSYNLKPRNSASILLIVNGKAKISSKICSRGSVLFIPANDEVEIKVLCDCHPMLMFQAFSNV